MDIILNAQRLPEVGENVLGTTYGYSHGGKGANQATALARLGASVKMIGKVADDDNGKALLENLKNNGIDASGVATDGSATGLAWTSIGGVTLTIEVAVMKGKGNYLGEAKICYQLKPQEITKLKPKVIDKVYTGKEIKLEETDIIIKSGTIQLIYGQDFIVLEDTYKNNLNKGTASVTIKGVGNYAGVKTVKFKIRQKPLIWGKFLSLFGGEQEEVNFNGN